MKPVKTVELSKPIEYGELVVTKLEFRELKAKHLRGFKASDLEDLSFDKILDLVADLTGQPPELIDRLSIKDFGAVSEIATDFLFENGKDSTEPQ